MTDEPDPYRTAEIAALQQRITAWLADDPTDPLLKIAALRATAETYQQAVLVRSMLASLYKALDR